MLPLKAKRYAFNTFLALVYLGIPVFAVLAFYPVMLANAEALAELEKAEQTLGVWLGKGRIPTQTRIQAELDYKEGMQAEIERITNYYKHRDGLLECSSLDTYTKDPIHVKLQYQKLKQELAAKARHERTAQVFRTAFMPPYAWEEPQRKPRVEDFDAIQKRACIAESLVRILCTRNPCHIGQLAIGEPARRDDEELAAARAAGLGYVRRPVTVDCLIWFRQLGATLDSLTAPPAGSPCVVLRSLEFRPSIRDHVAVHMEFDVLDFEQMEAQE